MSMLLRLVFTLFYLCICRGDDARVINSDCARALTRNGTHNHMAPYIGYVSDKIVGVHTDKTYNYQIGICTIADQIMPGCAVIQYGGNGTSPNNYCIGQVSRSQVSETNDHVWVELTYTGGNAYHSHCNGELRKARIVFICDPLIPGMGNVEFLEENRDDDLCYYLFTIASSQICNKRDLSVGDIILILMACIVLIWIVAMTIGTIYKRMFLGSKGFEQIPFIGFYREFGNLEADGCDLVCRSSNSVAPSKYKPPAPPFSAETDEETDEEKDDNLLPILVSNLC